MKFSSKLSRKVSDGLYATRNTRRSKYYVCKSMQITVRWFERGLASPSTTSGQLNNHGNFCNHVRIESFATCHTDTQASTIFRFLFRRLALVGAPRQVFNFCFWIPECVRKNSSKELVGVLPISSKGLGRRQRLWLILTCAQWALPIFSVSNLVSRRQLRGWWWWQSISLYRTMCGCLFVRNRNQLMHENLPWRIGGDCCTSIWRVRRDE